MEKVKPPEQKEEGEHESMKEDDSTNDVPASVDNDETPKSPSGINNFLAITDFLKLTPVLKSRREEKEGVRLG